MLQLDIYQQQSYNITDEVHSYSNYEIIYFPEKTRGQKTGEERTVGKRQKGKNRLRFLLQNSIIRRYLLMFHERSFSMSLFEEILQN